MEIKHIEIISNELNVEMKQVENTARLLEGGATIPFISRYRKEATGSLDEVRITEIRDHLEKLAELDARRNAILKSLTQRDMLTPELEHTVATAPTLTELEDVYLPYRPKRRTRAAVAKEKGLEPLADIILVQENTDIISEAEKFINEEKEVRSTDDALAGARDIIAERVNEDQSARERIRRLFHIKSQITSRVVTGAEEEAAKYRDYFQWSEPASNAPSHRVLAMFRGEKEALLIVHVAPPEEEALDILESMFIKSGNPAGEQVAAAVRDGYKRLLAPSLETEFRKELKQKADAKAISVFADNLRELLLMPPLGEKRVLAIDPGFRTGCKVVCLDSQGKLLHNDIIFPTQSQRMKQEADTKLRKLIEEYDIEAIAVGNGTAGRETEEFIRKMGLPGSIPIVMVNESGASIYSASEAAREEFPDHDLTVRGAVSIGRRMMDPLAELVKIDPKSIGVGQYQHDVDQKALKRSLDDVVMSAVNAVGVEVNTASVQLLSYVSGLGPQLAGNIVAFRDENGAFDSRASLKKVPRLGPKAFEQAAGFLRIRGAANPLDSSAVHPESYHIVKAMAKDNRCTVADLMKDEILRKKIDLRKYIDEKAGLPTLEDIVRELSKPGRDPRSRFEAFSFAEGVSEMKDLTPGMKLPGIVTNVTAFGAFVDVGVHQDGLVHISQLADRFVRNASDIVKVGMKVEVTVVDVDISRKRIALSMKKNPEIGPHRKK